MGDSKEKPRFNTAKRRHAEKITTYPEDQIGDEEIDSIRAMVAKNPDSLDLKEWLAIKLYGANKLDEAVIILEELVERGHNLLNAHYYLGNARYKLGHPIKAAISWRYVAETAPDSVKGQKASVRLEKVSKQLD